MNIQRIFQSRHAVARTTAVIVLIVVLVASTMGGILLFTYSVNTSKPLLAQTTEYSTFQPVSSLGNGTWQFEENNFHVYNYTYDVAIPSFNTTVGETIIVPPTLYNGLLLVDLSNTSSQSSGGIVAINVQNGQTVWKTTFANMLMTQPLTYEGLVIVGLGNNNFKSSFLGPVVRGTGANYVVALNYSTGQVVWTFATNGEDMPTPVIYSGLVVWANGDGAVYELNALTGQEASSSHLPSGAIVSMSSPVLQDNLIYFGARNSYSFYCFNLTNNQVVWSTNTPATGGLDDCSPVIWNNIVISGYTVKNSAGLLEPVLFAMNATNGQILWQVNQNAGAMPPAIQVPPLTISNGIVYSDPTESGILYAVNATNGAVLWTYQTGGDTSNVNIFSGDLWMVNQNGTLLVLNPLTGALLDAANVGGSLGPGNLIFAGQSVIICEQSGRVISMPVSDICPEQL